MGVKKLIAIFLAGWFFNLAVDVTKVVRSTGEFFGSSVPYQQSSRGYR